MRIRTLALAGTTALLLSACGSDGNGMADLTGPEVAERAATELEDAGSATVTGSFDLGGETGEIDLHLQGEDAVGTVTTAGVDVELLASGGQYYLQAPPEFWSQSGLPPAFAEGLGGRWVLLPSDGASDFGQLTLAGLAGELRSPTDGSIQDEVRVEERDGAQVVVAETDSGGTLTVAGEGTPYPLEIESTGEDAGTLTFSRFGEEEDITAPADALDLSELGG